MRDPLTGQPFPGGVIPASRMDPYAVAIMALVPLPNQPGPNNFFRQADLLDNSDRILGRLDYKMSANDSLFGRYIYSNRTRQIPGEFRRGERREAGGEREQKEHRRRESDGRE